MAMTMAMARDGGGWDQNTSVSLPIAVQCVAIVSPKARDRAQGDGGGAIRFIDGNGYDNDTRRALRCRRRLDMCP